MTTTGRHSLNSDQAALIGRIKAAEEAFLAALDDLAPGREKSLAFTNAEQAAMWAVRAAARTAP